MRKARNFIREVREVRASHSHSHSRSPASPAPASPDNASQMSADNIPDPGAQAARSDIVVVREEDNLEETVVAEAEVEDGSTRARIGVFL